MVKFRFRAFRKFCLGSIGLASIICIILSLSLFDEFNPKADVCVLIAVPSLCLTGCVCSINAKRLFKSDIPHCVAIECIWISCFVPFNLILSMFCYGLSGQFREGMPTDRFMALEVFCWLLASLVFLYCFIVVGISLTTAFTVDKDVWFRDIAGSPSPFPLPLILFSMRQSIFGTSFAAEHAEAHAPQCLPGCTCNAKLAPSSPPLALPPIGFLRNQPRRDSAMTAGSVRSTSSVPVRVPTAMERHNSILVGFDHV
ncbi:hypothetical protein FA95DRAFT_1189268 [Auriscalpium vulgare]|uniref:Uncharacterized protein n=1 Tax=Auriscalpium vulgare TaxID=40419 RepID=A0ACB8RVB2_9AGAM|nr:hypothetical protein FA95DRAFT_1189268 [Auriscalpium vulgare]